MEEKKTKEVEIKTKSPMWVVVLVGVLVIALACEFVYIWKINTTQDLTTQENLVNENSSKIEEKNVEEDPNAVEVVGLDMKFTELSKAAVLSKLLDEEKNDTELEYDLNNDGIKEKISLTKRNEDGEIAIYYNNTKIHESITHEHVVNIVDLDETDNYLDVIIASLQDNDGFFDFYVYKNNGKNLEEVEYNYTNIISGDYDVSNYYKGRFYLDGKNNFVLLGNVQIDINRVVSDSYFTIDETQQAKKNIIDIDKIKQSTFEYKKKDYPNTFFSKTKKINSGKKYSSLKDGQEFKILAWVEEGIGMQVELTNGDIGYIYPVHTYLAG